MKPDFDYVEKANETINELTSQQKAKLTTTKIRNILTLVNEIYNDVILIQGDALPLPVQSRIKHMKVRLVYEAGRENVVKTFVKNALLLEGIDAIGDSKPNFLRFAKYLEALVAYHRYYA